MADTVVMHGLRRTGTNLLHFLIRKYLPAVPLADQSEFGWKHGPYCAPEHNNGKTTHLIIVVKHPIAWLPSVWRMIGKKFKHFPSFVHRTNAIERWNELYQNWLTCDIDSHARNVVRYEDVLSNPARALSELTVPGASQVRRAELPRRRMNTVGEPKGRSDFRRNYYTGGEYMKYFDERALKAAYERFDWVLAEQLGYPKKLEPQRAYLRQE